MGIPVIIDTDIGDDIDDALALALAAGCPDMDLVAVTTVFQCAGLRARLATHLLSAYGRADVPVLAGSDRPLVAGLRREGAPVQAAVLGAGDGHVPGGAVQRIIHEGMTRDGLVLVTIGAMTNAALALAVEPELAGRLRMVAMAGAWDRQGAEYNVACDPEAVASVLASGVDVAFVGLDVTTATVLTEAQTDRIQRAQGRGPEVLAAMLRLWQGGSPARPVLHDPLALAAAIDGSAWLGWRRVRVEVELCGRHCRGQTVVVSGTPNAAVAASVTDGFATWLTERLCGG